MLSSRFVRFTRLDRLRRGDGVADRVVALVFVARFTDEVLSGAWTVLAPTFQAVFQLSLVQIGLLDQLLNWVALVVEPVAAFHIDLRDRRSIMGLGACILGASVLLMGIAPNYGLLALAFGLYGIGSGPLVLTADVVVVEAFPTQAERAYSRATFLDTVGALAGPGLVALAAAAGVSWRVLLGALGGCAVVYGVAIATTRFPPPRRQAAPGGREAAPGGREAEPGGREAEPGGREPGGRKAEPGGRGTARQMLANARTVLANRRARSWLLVLLCFDLFEAAFVLKYIWLHDTLHLGESTVALWAVGEQGVNLVALALLDRWLARREALQVFRVAAAALLVLPTAWVVAPGLGGRIALGIPLAFVHALIWPLAKGQSLTAAPDLGGATQAIASLFPLVPLALGEAQLATTIGVGAAMAATATAGAALMLWIVARGVPQPGLVGEVPRPDQMGEDPGPT